MATYFFSARTLLRCPLVGFKAFNVRRHSRHNGSLVSSEPENLEPCACVDSRWGLHWLRTPTQRWPCSGEAAQSLGQLDASMGPGNAWGRDIYTARAYSHRDPV